MVSYRMTPFQRRCLCNTSSPSLQLLSTTLLLSAAATALAAGAPEVIRMRGAPRNRGTDAPLLEGSVQLLDREGKRVQRQIRYTVNRHPARSYNSRESHEFVRFSSSQGNFVVSSNEKDTFNFRLPFTRSGERLSDEATGLVVVGAGLISVIIKLLIALLLSMAGGGMTGGGMTG